MLTLTIPQSEPSAARKRSASRWSRVKMRRGQALGHAVVQGDRVLELAVGHHVQDRRERLAADDGGLGGHPDERRLDVVRVGGAVDRPAVAAGDELAAVGAGLVERLAPSRRYARPLISGPTSVPSADGSPIGSRANTSRRPATSSSATSSWAITRRRLVHRWPAVPAGGEHDPAGGELEVGRRRDHRGVVASELEQAAAETGGDAGRDLGAHPLRAGGAHERDVGAVDQRLSLRPHRRPRAGAARPARPTPRRRGRAGPQHAIAVSGVIGEGFQTTLSPHTSAIAVFHDHTAAGKLKAEITATTPSGCQVSISRWPGPLGRHRPAVELAREADREVADVDHLLNLAEGLGRDLPGLDRDQLADVGLVLAEQHAEPLDERAARRRRHHAPGRERGLGRGDRRQDLGLAGGRNLEQVLAGDRGARHHRRSGSNIKARAAALEASRARALSSSVEETDSGVELMRAGTTEATSSEEA